MEEMMEAEFGRLFREAPKNLTKERTLPDGTKVRSWGPFVYGYSVTMGPDGKPKIREFGNIKPETRLGSPRIDIKEKREPLADVLNCNGEVRVIVELPGVDKKDIKLHGTEERLTISVDTPLRKYYKEVRLPAKIVPDKARSTYKNGVLEVTLQKKKEDKPKGERIEIQ
ncbi:MAG: Hsp20/alpha crystallin family protein [Candidatus Bathyarchaeota archaeon]|nr:MAG: Hsp20/alpha crystallin family protein [Candidatus Bathyarchaeota archaeon]